MVQDCLNTFLRRITGNWASDISILRHLQGLRAQGPKTLVFPVCLPTATNTKRLYAVENKSKYVKDVSNNFIIEEDRSAVNPDRQGTKFSAWIAFDSSPSILAGDYVTVRFKYSTVKSSDEDLDAFDTSGVLEQADSAGWMAFFCLQMLNIALELAKHRLLHEDIASKFFEHFIFIADAMSFRSGGIEKPLWNDGDGFKYDAIS